MLEAQQRRSRVKIKTKRQGASAMKNIIIFTLCICFIGLLFNPGVQAGNSKVHLKKGELSKYTSLPSKTDLYVMKKDGTYDQRANDLEEMCRDYVFYRNRILKYTRSGDLGAAADARNSFNQINNTLSIQYYEDDTSKMFTLIER
jgi:hypothetical protein